MADKIIRVLAKDAPVKASAITAKEMVERARQIHKTLPVATAALGRSLMAASMMGNQLKEKDGSVTLRIKGGGPLGGITVVSDSQGNARGYVVNPLVDLPLKGPAKLDVGSAVGRDGSLTVIKDLCMKEPGPCEPKGGIAAAVSHDNLTPRLPLQLLQRITQDCKAVRGFMPPGYGVEIQQFFTAGYFYQNTVKHHKETSCHAAWARSSAARSTKNDSCLYCSSAKVTAAPPRESRYWRPFLDFEM